MRSFGFLVKAEMERQDMQIFDLVDKTGINHQRFSRLFSKKYATPYPREIRLISKALGVAEEELEVHADDGSFIEVLQVARAKEHISIQRLADESGVNVGIVQRVLQGRSRNITDANIDKLADALHLKRCDLRAKARRVTFDELESVYGRMERDRRINALVSVVPTEELFEAVEALPPSARADLVGRLQAQEVLG